jgi:putative transposase
MKAKRKAKQLETIWKVPDELWIVIWPILLRAFPTKIRGRPRADWRRILNGIIYQMRTGCQWNHLPKEFGSDRTVHRWFTKWCRAGVFKKVWSVLLRRSDELGDVKWKWQSADGAMGKARMGGDLIGKNPTDRGKNGVKRSLIVDKRGGPLGAVVAGANRHDTKLLKQTIESIVVRRPNPRKHKQHLCLDKGYDNPTGHRTCKEKKYVEHIRAIGEEKKWKGKKITQTQKVSTSSLGR